MRENLRQEKPARIEDRLEPLRLEVLKYAGDGHVAQARNLIESARIEAETKSRSQDPAEKDEGLQELGVVHGLEYAVDSLERSGGASL